MYAVCRGYDMHTGLRSLADIERRLAEAVAQLRQQQDLVAGMDCEGRNREVSLRLLSNMLRQFRVLETERSELIQCLATIERERDRRAPARSG